MNELQIIHERDLPEGVAEVKCVEDLPQMLAPYVLMHGPVNIYTQDHNGINFFTHGEPKEVEGAELSYRVAARGYFGKRSIGAKVYTK